MQWDFNGEMGIALYGLLKTARCLLLKIGFKSTLLYNFFVSCLK